MKAEEKTNKQKIGFLGKFMCMYEQPCMCKQDYAPVGSYPETLKTQKQGRTLKHKF